MQEISRLPHKLDREKRECQAIIETPKGRRNKFKYEEESGLFTLSRVLPQGFLFPFEFGFIPSTAAQDGDPLDVIVLMDEPAHVGCIVQIRLIGVIRLVQQEKGKKTENDRLVGVGLRGFEYEAVRNISDLQELRLKQITDFLQLYNKDSGKEDTVTGVDGPERAVELLQTAIASFKKNEEA
ncbi:MAG TPA: inorganic diphosphatase [Bryobacteraceae bacterium]|nr:inorganic diphosphatase [Bryobacteraceae bacterium]